MFKKPSFNFSLNQKLVFMMLFLSFILISALLLIYSQAERNLFREIERQTRELTKAIQIGVEEVTASGATDEARLSKYLKALNAKGIKEISVISNANEVVASTNLSRIGQPLTYKKRELIIKAELGEPVSEEGRTYNVILPVIAGDTQYGYLHLKINKDDFSSFLRMNTVKKIVATILVFGMGIVITLSLSRRYIRPIKRIADAAVRIAAGDLNQNIPIGSRDEVGQLAEGFNFMVKKLRENRALEKRLREAEHLSGLGQLSQNMAHEIRNPLNFISLSIDHIRGKYRPDATPDREEFNDLISGIKQEVDRLNKLVSDFLNYGRPINLNLQKVKIEELLQDVFSLIWAKAEADGIHIRKEFISTCQLDVDPDLLKSCILNVINNAFHSMEVSGKEKLLTVKTQSLGQEFVLSIIDNGKGVLSEHLTKIFEPFFSTKQNGLGLGLPMTKRVIEEHGGRIEFNSVEGEGSEIKLILPIHSLPYATNHNPVIQHPA